eukprot:g9536.t2
MTQTWMNQRFQCLAPTDFEEGVHFVSIGNVSPLSEVQNIWSALGKGQDASTLVPSLKAKRVLFIFASPIDQGQVAKLRELIQCLDATDAPPMVWAPHTVPPEIRPHQAIVDPQVNDGPSSVSRWDLEPGAGRHGAAKGRKELGAPVTATDSTELGLDGIVSGEPQGEALALVLGMWVQKLEIAAETVAELMAQRRRKAANVEYYKGHTDSLLWDYLRSRMAPVIPPCDRYLQAGEPDHLDGWAFGSCRRTANGLIYRLNRRRPESSGLGGSKKEVAFLVDKQKIRNITQMMALKRMVDALWMVSCEKWQHPNIQRLFQVYHSPTHIIMRMECAAPIHSHRFRRRFDLELHSFGERADNDGAEGWSFGMKVSCCDNGLVILDVDRSDDTIRRELARNPECAIFPGYKAGSRYAGAGSLHDRLCRVERRPLSFAKAAQLLQQLFRAVSHLHLGPKVCHRDIKPESFDLHETVEMISLKLTNFQLAFCGTVPFVAPEILKGERYDGMAADMWGVGITVIEILCGSRSVDKVLGIEEKVKSFPDETFLANLLEVFQEPGSASRILQSSCFPEFQGFRLTLSPWLNALLAVEPEERQTGWEPVTWPWRRNNSPKALPLLRPCRQLPCRSVMKMNSRYNGWRMRLTGTSPPNVMGQRSWQRGHHRLCGTSQPRHRGPSKRSWVDRAPLRRSCARGGQVGCMGADDLDAETLKRLKREAAIRSKEQDFERRKKAPTTVRSIGPPLGTVRKRTGFPRDGGWGAEGFM